MDPNHWTNLNQQYAARLTASGVPTNPGTLPFLEQHGLTAASKPQHVTPKIYLQ
jgi:hypothetical protein